MRAVMLFLFLLLVVRVIAQENPLSDKPHLLFTSQHYIHNLHWSPDGKYIAFQVADPLSASVYMVNVLTGETRELLRANHSELFLIAWSPDSKAVWLARYGPYDMAIYRFNVEDGALENFTERLGWNSEPFPSPDSRFAAVIQYKDDYSDDTTLDLWDIQTGQLVWSIDQRILFDSLLWTPDGKYLLFETEHFEFEPQIKDDSGLYRVQVSSGDIAYLTDASILSYVPPAMSPDGKMIAYGAESLDTEWPLEIHILDVNSGETRNLGGFDAEYGFSWSHDSQYLAYGLSELEIIEVSTGRRCNLSQRVVKQKPMYATFEQPLWSPTENRLVVRLRDIYLIDAATLTSQSLLPEGRVLAYDMAWSPDGQQLAYTASGRTDVELRFVDVPNSANGTMALDECLARG
jgi:Tol biopolymer transport system component